MMKVGIIIIMAACHTAMAAEQSWRAGMIVGTPGIRQFQAPSRCESAAAEPGGPLYAMPAVSFTYVLRCMCMCLHKNGYSPEQENIITMLSALCLCTCASGCVLFYFPCRALVWKYLVNPSLYGPGLRLGRSCKGRWRRRVGE